MGPLRIDLVIPTPEQMHYLQPYFVMACGTVLAVIVSTIRWIQPKWPTVLVVLGSMILALIQTIQHMGQNFHHEIFNSMMMLDGYSALFNAVFLASGIITVIVSMKYLDRDQLQYPEYYTLTAFSVLGMMLLTSATDLISLFVALEIMSLGVYVLVGFRRADRKSNEAAVKYFILGSAASALLLYGTALLYGATQTTSITQILNAIKTHPEAMTQMFSIGFWLVVVGFLFKVASVPFHMWMPDVYEGAPAPVTGFMTTGLKAASFATFVRVFLSLGYGKDLSDAIALPVHQLLWISAVLTMLIGNLVALAQTNLKRMLAYSSIAHTGYLLVAVLTGAHSEMGYAPLALYLISYSLMNLGAFVIMGSISGNLDSGLHLHEIAGLAKRRPWIAFAMTVFLFSMAGIPPTAGFAAKYLVFYSAVQAGETLLVVIGVLCSAISVYYYLRVLVFMYMKEPFGSAASHSGHVHAGHGHTDAAGGHASVVTVQPTKENAVEVLPIGLGAAAALIFTVVLTIQLGLMPSPLLEMAKRLVVGM